MTNKKYGFSAKQVERYGFKLCLRVFEEYNGRCADCGTENRLAIHHKDRSGQTGSPNNSLDNIQPLCISCHGRLHSNQYWSQKLPNGYLKKGREKEYHAEWYKNNKEKDNTRSRKYYQEHKEKWLKYNLSSKRK